MIEPLIFLWPSFLVAVCLVGIHAYFGIQVLARKVIFVDLALAQIAALGATVAFMLGHPAQSLATYGYSLAFTLLAAVLLAFTRAWGTRVPQEALIGVIYVVAAAAAILLIDRAPQGAEHLKQILTGNILTSGLNEVAVIVPLYAAVGLLHWLLRRRLTRSGIARLGIRLLCDFRRGRDQLGRDRRRAAGVFVSHHSRRHRRHVRVIAGKTARDRLDCRHVHQRRRPCRLVCLRFADRRGHGLRLRRRAGGGGIALSVSARQSPKRAARRDRDRPLDWRRYSGGLRDCNWQPRRARTSRSSTWSNTRFLRSERCISRAPRRPTFADASEYAERYRKEAEQLNDVERRNRTEGAALDDFSVARISSFLKSYGEMRKGEQFVMGEVRARARERVRWGASLGLLAFCTPGCPSSVGGAYGCASTTLSACSQSMRALGKSGLVLTKRQRTEETVQRALRHGVRWPHLSA